MLAAVRRRAPLCSRLLHGRVVATESDYTGQRQLVADDRGLHWLPKQRKARDPLAVFFPHDYPDSVPPEYARFTAWSAVASVASSASCVLATQSMLMAVGLGAGAIPTAAALNWVLKDGLGQLGGVLFASRVHVRFDADPKRWRMVAALALDAATALEVLTPLAPHLFLPLAALANVGKNVSWLSASAAKAAIHRSFARANHNLGDITAKATSQAIACSVLGTAAGAALAAGPVGASTPVVGAAVAGLAAAHLLATRRALSLVTLTTLNEQRLGLVARAFLRDGAPGVPSPEQLRHRERLQPGEAHVQACAPLSALLDWDVRALEDLAVPGERYLVHGARFALLEGATDRDAVRAWLHAASGRRSTGEFEEALEREGWDLGAVTLESDEGRRVVLSS